MPRDWKQRFSWVNIATYAKDQETVVDEINILFYKLQLPFRKRIDEHENWLIEVPWVYEIASRKALEAYHNNNLEYPKDFGGLKPIEKKLMYHFEPIRRPSRMLFVAILVIFVALALVKWLIQIGII